mgnify:CR=1 FL=1
MTEHTFSQDLVTEFESTAVTVHRENDGQFKIYASYNIPGNSPSINEIDVKTISIPDVLGIMKIAIERMISENQESATFRFAGLNEVEFLPS